MNLVDRAKQICVTPKSEWAVIAGEQDSNQQVISGYVIPLAGVSALAAFVGGSLVGRTLPFIGTFRVPIVTGLVGAVLSVVMAVVGVMIVGAIANALAPRFGAVPDSAKAFKVAAYSFTPAWVAGVLQILPALGALAILGGLYGIYLLYLGLQRVMQSPSDRAAGYTALVVVCAIVVSIVAGTIVGAITGVGIAGAGALGRFGSTPSGAGAVADAVDPDLPLGQLGALGAALENAARQAEQAAAQGDAAGQVNAAMEGLGALLGGGTRVEPLTLEELRGFVPESLAGLPRTALESEQSPIGYSRVGATFGEPGGPVVEFELIDSGGMAGLMGLAGWMGVEAEREDASGSERTRREGDRFVHEVSRTDGGTNEFATIVGNRFMVSAASADVQLEALRGSLSAAADLDGLDALAAQGR
jgi:hypothetical protein